jgi:hypothetical protein
MIKQLGKCLAVTFAMMAGGCIVTADTYEECVTDTDCFSNDYCQPYSSRSADTAICTQGCLDNRDCPTTRSGFEGVCLPFGVFDACVESCRDDFDCATGFNCEVETLTGFDYLVCVPR